MAVYSHSQNIKHIYLKYREISKASWVAYLTRLTFTSAHRPIKKIHGTRIGGVAVQDPSTFYRIPIFLLGFHMKIR